MPPVSPPRPPAGPGVPPADESRREADRDGRGKRTAFEFDVHAQSSEADAARDKHTVFGMTASEFVFNPHGAGRSAQPTSAPPGQVAVNRAQGIGQHPVGGSHAASSQPFAFSNASLTSTAPHGFAAPPAPPASPGHRLPAHGGSYEHVAPPVQVVQQVQVVQPVRVAPPLQAPPSPAPYAPVSHGASAPHHSPAARRDRTPATVFAAPAYIPEAPAVSRSPDYARHAGGFQPVLTPPAARKPGPATPHYDPAPQARHEPSYALPAVPTPPLPTTQPSLAQITSHARPTAAMDAQQLLQASIELPEFGGSSSASRPAHDRGDSSSGWPARADESDSSSPWRVSHDPDLDGDRTRESDDSASRWPARKELPAHASSRFSARAPEDALRPPSGKAKYAEARSVEKPMQLRGKFSSDDEGDLDRVLGRKLSRGKLLIGACALALLFCAGAFYIKASRSEPVLAAAPAATQEAQRPGAQRQQTRPAPVEQASADPAPEGERQLAAREPPAPAPDVAPATPQPARDEVESPARTSDQIPVGSPVPETSAERRRAARHERRQHGAHEDATLEPVAEVPAPPQPELAAPAEPAPVQGGVTERSAAALYINGKYKEAHAEYLLLAQAHPKQRVYVELARILRRRLIETCVRTQPHRSEQCREL